MKSTKVLVTPQQAINIFRAFMSTSNFQDAVDYAERIFLRADVHKSVMTELISEAAEKALEAGEFDQARAIKENPAWVAYLTERVIRRIQYETPTLIMRAPAAPTDFDDDTPTIPRGTVVAG